MHDSPLLNTVTPNGEHVYMTMSTYIEVGACAHPICLTRDLCMAIHPRDSKLALPK